MTIAGWNILMTGGTGLIGRHLVPILLEGGAKVFILTRHPETARIPHGAEFVGWDGKTPAGWGHLMEMTTAVINLAGESLNAWPWSSEQLQRIRSSRTNAGQALVTAIQAASHRPKVLIQSSAIGYYGNTDDREVDEASPAGNDLLAEIVVDWENSTKPVEALGVRRPVIRTALVMDAHEGVLPTMALPFKLFVGGPLGSGCQWVSWIHIHDEIQAIRYLLENENLRGAFVLGSPHPLTNADFGKVLAKSLNRPYWFPTPAPLLKLVLGKMASLVLEGQRAIPARLLEHDFSFRYPDLPAALNDLYAFPVEHV